MSKTLTSLGSITRLCLSTQTRVIPSVRYYRTPSGVQGRRQASEEQRSWSQRWKQTGNRGLCSINSPGKVQMLRKENVVAGLDEYIASGRPDKRICLVDVREPSEIQETGSIAHNGCQATNIPLGDLPEALEMNDEDFEARYKTTKPCKENDMIIFNCKAGVRSANACAVAQSAGFKKIGNYSGGADDWFSS